MKNFIQPLTFFVSVLPHLSIAGYKNAPIIGILSQEYHDDDLETYFKGHKSYIAASYVKAVEAAGAQVVPIMIGQPQAYYEKLMNHINGLLIPGGAAWFNDTEGYVDAGNTIVHIAEKMNKRGNHFPILGICLGFELLVHISNSLNDVRTRCNVFHHDLTLKFHKNGSRTGIYKDFSHKNIRALATQNITFNYHLWCVLRSEMKKNNLLDKWTILTESTYKDTTFVSTVQSKQYPFVGIQFHPEKLMYEWFKNIDHSRTGIETNRLFYDWLIAEAYRSSNSYPSRDDLYKELIYNYQPTIGGLKAGFEQVYFFD